MADAAARQLQYEYKAVSLILNWTFNLKFYIVQFFKCDSLSIEHLIFIVPPNLIMYLISLLKWTQIKYLFSIIVRTQILCYKPM